MVEKVYIILQGLEEERILQGYRAHPAKKVVIIRNSQVFDYNRKVEEVINGLISGIKDKLKYVVSEMEEFYVNFFDFTEAFKGIYEVLKRERERGNEVIVNITGGTRLVASAALVASFLTGSKPIYVSADEYTRMEVIAKKAGRVYEIPVIPLGKRSKIGIKILRTLYKDLNGFSPSLEELARALGEDVPLDKRANRAKYAKILAKVGYHVKLLNDQGLVETWYESRRQCVKLTASGLFIASSPDVFPLPGEENLRKRGKKTGKKTRVVKPLALAPEPV